MPLSRRAQKSALCSDDAAEPFPVGQGTRTTVQSVLRFADLTETKETGRSFFWIRFLTAMLDYYLDWLESDVGINKAQFQVFWVSHEETLSALFGPWSFLL